jgi:hypothetical protein
VARRISFSLVDLSFLILLALASAVPAQTPVTLAFKPSPSPCPAASVTLGQSAVHLYAPWKFSVGDSPLDPATHQPLWAEPAFDDSHWEDVDLTPKEGATDPITGLSGYVPGWTARGHAGYWGYAWYRIRVHVEAQPGQRLALAGPYNVDDVKQAQEVQQVILPRSRISLPALEIESEYRPARKVGGDFFQIIPDPTDSSLLIVAGDVAGNGLKAGMMVALLVGGIRSAVDWTSDPALVLRALNKRLIGRGDAQATCLALRIEASGAVTLVNAGHLPPYLNGMPLDMEGALPLGIAEDAEPSILRFHLATGDRLVVISDGVAEAADSNGNLYGFDRAAQLLQSAGSAAEVAAAAQRFGQRDDISVIALRRTLIPAA